MNANKILNHIYSLYFVGRDIQHPEIITCDRVHQKDGSFLWKVMKSGSCLSSEGYFGYEPLPSSRNQEYLDSHRFKTLEEACRAFKFFLEVQSNPEHKFYVKGYQQHLPRWKEEFNNFLADLEINL